LWRIDSGYRGNVLLCIVYGMEYVGGTKALHVDGIVDDLGVYYLEPLLVSFTATYLRMILLLTTPILLVPVIRTKVL